MSDYLTQTQLGKLYGVSSHQIGKWFKNLGLRTESGQPSNDAFTSGMVKQAPSTQPGTYFWVWHKSKTTTILDAMCYPRAVLDEDERQHRSGDS